MLDSQNKDMAENHFKCVILLNLVIFAFYTLFRIYAMGSLIVMDADWLYGARFNFHQPNSQDLVIYRLFLPILILAGFLFFFYLLFRKPAVKSTVSLLKELFSFDRRSLARYLLLLFLSFVLLSLCTNFSVLLKNITAEYAFTDIDSYVSMVINASYGDYNPSWEGGLILYKYYPVTMPTLFIMLLSGAEHVVSAYNITMTLLVFVIILNMAFIFRNAFYEKNERVIDEVRVLLFIAVAILIFLKFTLMQLFFGYNVLLVTYLAGFYGGISGIFLYTSIMFVVSHLLREGMLSREKTLQLILLFGIFGAMLVQGYFHMCLFLLPSGAVTFTLMLARKDSRRMTLCYAFLLFYFIIVLIYGSSLSLDIVPRPTIDPFHKLKVLSTGLVVLFIISTLINRWTDNMLLRIFFRFRFFFILTLFLFPFLLVFAPAHIHRVELSGFALRIGSMRVYILYILLYAITTASLLYAFLRWVRLTANNYIMYTLIGSLLLVPLFVEYPDAKQPLKYPLSRSAERVYIDKSNLYAFDSNGIKVTYNEYLVGVIKYFIQNDIHDLYYWIVSKTPSQGMYEHGLIQRMLMLRGHEIEGITVKEHAAGSRAPDWARISLDDTTVEDYDSFVRNIFEIEEKTRRRENRFKRRYMILDDNFPTTVLEQLDRSELFKRVFENKLYKVYSMEYSKIKPAT